tara:strand:- start:399 stop:1133 length:735 start_codon:yes stop_codon:yes gene_type:complete
MIYDSLKHIKNKIQQNSKVILFVRLKGLMNDNSGYKNQTSNLLDMIREQLLPVEIYVPTFTYNFTNTNFFDVDITPSEVGRFSEEIRSNSDYKYYRTLDPIFSVIETEKGLFKNRKINNNAFGASSVWKYLNKEPHYIININLNAPIIMTQLHYLEYENQVEYRYMKYFNGTVKDWNKINHKITYGYYVRKNELDPIWNRKKLLKICKEKKLVIENGPLKIFKWYGLSNLLKEKLSKNPNYLII